MNKPQVSTSLLLLILSFQPLKANSLRPEVPDPASVAAFQQFWSTFEDYESHHQALEQGKHFGSWDQIRHEWTYHEQKQRDQQLNLLQEAAQRYQQHLEASPDASNAGYVKLNLAQILNKIGLLQDEKQPGAGLGAKRQALAMLSDLNKESPSFALMEETQYLRATIHESLEQSETAHAIWQNLAKQARSTLYGVHASIAVGDHAFTKERPQDALKAYRKAQEILLQLETPDKDFEVLRLQYRLAWAAYRAADLELCIQVSQELLEPGREFRQLSVKRRVERDASELLGDALFELDDMKKTKAVLQKNVIRPFAGAIGLRLMTRLISMPTKVRLLDFGQFLVERYPQVREMPDILTLLADSYKELKQTENYLATLERLALMLPQSSLWRLQHKSEPDTLKNMQEKAQAANALLAAHYYEQGMTQNNAPAYKSAFSYYETLLRFDPQNPEAENWQLRRAHSLFFAGKWPEADRAYADFRNHTVTAANLELAFYQQALAREKMWRESLQKTLSDRGDARKNPIVIERLRNLESIVDDFADRFPNKAHSNDLLLLVASANRDLNDFKQAERYWNRTLLSEPSPAQRTLAIRGLIQAKIRADNAQDVFTLTRDYLKLENWAELGPTFKDEMHGILAISARNASEDLNKKGRIIEAGKLLLKVCEEFPELPDRESIYRDGAYLLAIAGDWNASLQAATSYLADRNLSHRQADMLYLKARSLEYQLRFADSAQAHLSLGQNFPRYPKSIDSVRRAEELALAEEDFSLAGKAAMASISYAKNDEIKLSALSRAARHFTQAKEWNEAVSILQEAKKKVHTSVAQLPLNIQLARVYMAQGDEKKALQIYQQLVKETAQKQEDIDQEAYRSIAGEASFQLAEHHRRSFEELDLSGGLGDLSSRVQEKTQLLERSLQHYNQAIQTRDAEWSSRGRYGAGQLAENMAQSINTALAGKNLDIKNAELKSLQDQLKRWQGLAQEYFSQNLLARHREPHRFKNSIWMERSALKVAGLKAQKSSGDAETEVPTALGTSQPYQWSH